MDKKLRDEWVAALRSGEYKQGNTFLVKGEGDSERWCCLGVLCDIGIDGYWYSNPKGSHWELLDYVSTLPDPFMYSIGGIPEAYLIDMNDSFENSFDEIADWIEKNL